MVRGRVTPAVAGVVVRIQLRPSGRKSFRSVRSVRAARSGRFAARLRLRRPGSYNLRATVVRTATILGSRSRPVALRVR